MQKTMRANQSLNTPWVATQHRTFTRWSNIFLQKHATEPTEIEGLVKPPDLKTGYKLILLLESLSKKDVLKTAADRRKAKNETRFQYMDNTSRALMFMKQERITTVNIGAEDIVDANLVLTLGLIWALILHYQIVAANEMNTPGAAPGSAAGGGDKQKGAAKTDLLQWVNARITPLGAPAVKNFGKDWSDGVALCALNESIASGSMGPDGVEAFKRRGGTPQGNKENIQNAMEVGDTLGIPRLLEIEDLLADEPDELSVMTLVGVYRAKKPGGVAATPRDLTSPVDDERRKALDAEEEERRRKLAEEEADRRQKLAEEEAARRAKLAEEEEQRKKNAEADRQRREAEEKARKEAAEAARLAEIASLEAIRKAEEERRKREGELAREKRLNEEQAAEAARRKREAEEAAAAESRRRRDEEEAAAAAARRRREEEEAAAAAARRRREEEELEAAKRKRELELENLRRMDEEAAERRRRADEEAAAARKKRDLEEEEARKRRAAEEEEARKRRIAEEEDARKKREAAMAAEEAERLRKAEEAEAERRRKTVDPSKCFADGPGVEEGAQSGKDTKFTIHSVNCDGDELKTGGADFAVDIDGPDGITKGKVVDNKDGTYTVTYRLSKPGNYKVACRCNGQKGASQPLPKGHPGFGQHIEDSPYTIECVKSEEEIAAAAAAAAKRKAEEEEEDRKRKTADPAKCYATGPGIEDGAQTNQDAHFTIQSVNCNGDEMKTGGCDFTVDVEGPDGKSKGKVVDNKDGTYHGTYKVSKPGDYKVAVRLAGQRGITQLPQGHPGYGQGGQHIEDSPYSVKARINEDEEADRRKKTADPSKCYANGPGIEDGAQAGKDAPFTIQSVNCNGDDLKTGGCEYDVEIDGPDGKSKAKVTDNKDGTYSGVYRVNKPGDYKIGIKMVGQKGVTQLPEGHPGFGQHIEDSPYSVKCSKNEEEELRKTTADPSKCYATGPGVGDHSGSSTNSNSSKSGPSDGGNGAPEAGTDVKFVIHSVNSNGDKLTTGGCEYDVEVDGPDGKTKAKVTDNKDGTYSGVYRVNKPGNYKVTARLISQKGVSNDKLPPGHPGFGKPIKDSPVTVAIIPNAEEAEREAKRAKAAERAKRKEEEEAARLRALEEEANKKASSSEEDDTKSNSSEEGGGTQIYSSRNAPPPASSPSPTPEYVEPVSEIVPATSDKIKSRRGGCFVCEVNKDYGKRNGKLILRAYLANQPLFPGGDIEIDTEVLEEPGKLFAQGLARHQKVWIESNKGMFKGKTTRVLEDKPMVVGGFEGFRDARLVWKLPDDLELTKTKVKHNLCMDVTGSRSNKVIRFRWPIEEVTVSKSVIKRPKGGGDAVNAAPKPGSVGALLADRKGGGGGGSSPGIGSSQKGSTTSTTTTTTTTTTKTNNSKKNEPESEETETESSEEEKKSDDEDSTETETDSEEESD